jgi:hypothetical protein
MNARQQVELFAARNGIKVCGKHGIPMLSKQLSGDKWFIDCFDNWRQALDFIKAELAKVEAGGKAKWHE